MAIPSWRCADALTAAARPYPLAPKATRASSAPKESAAAAMAAKDTTSKMFVVCGRDADLLYEAELNANFDAESPTAHLSHFVLQRGFG